jgi:hypothetical protein
MECFGLSCIGSFTRGITVFPSGAPSLTSFRKGFTPDIYSVPESRRLITGILYQYTVVTVGNSATMHWTRLKAYGELPRGIKSPKTKVLTRQAAGNVPAEIQRGFEGVGITEHVDCNTSTGLK